MIADLDWEPIKLVDIETEPATVFPDERLVRPLFSRQPSVEWKELFSTQADHVDLIRWDWREHQVVCDYSEVESVRVQLTALTALANAMFTAHLVCLRACDPHELSELLEAEAMHAAAESGSISCGWIS